MPRESTYTVEISVIGQIPIKFEECRTEEAALTAIEKITNNVNCGNLTYLVSAKPTRKDLSERFGWSRKKGKGNGSQKVAGKIFFKVCALNVDDAFSEAEKTFYDMTKDDISIKRNFGDIFLQSIDYAISF